MKFSETIKHSKHETVVSERHDAWAMENANAKYSDAAREFALGQLQAVPRKRSGTYSASSLGACGRQQQFGYIGLPQIAPSSRGAAIFHNGSFMHLRWQMEGITEGWLREAEVAIPENDYRLSGTMDGICDDGSILELKSINDNGFRSVLAFGPQKKHLMQGYAYALATGIKRVVFLYENKNDQEYREFVVDITEEHLEEAKDRAKYLWEKTDKRELIGPLSKCIDKEGFDYKYCPFRDQCLGIRSWNDAIRAKAG